MAEPVHPGLTEDQLREQYPLLPWDEPIPIHMEPPLKGGPRMGCRYCIAQEGLLGADVHELPKTRAEHSAHLLVRHRRMWESGE